MSLIALLIFFTSLYQFYFYIIARCTIRYIDTFQCIFLQMVNCPKPVVLINIKKTLKFLFLLRTYHIQNMYNFFAHKYFCCLMTASFFLQNMKKEHYTMPTWSNLWPHSVYVEVNSKLLSHVQERKECGIDDAFYR